MVSYPVLTPQQQNLPALIKPAKLLPQPFDDSSHQVWLCQTVDGPLVLKTCNHDNIEQSTFWQGMNCLFDIDFPNSLRECQQTYQFLAQKGHFSIPEHIHSEAGSFVLAKFLHGRDIDNTVIEDSWVVELAQHLSQLHDLTYSSWGELSQPQFDDYQWSDRLVTTLTVLTRQQSVPKKLFEQAIKQAKAIECNNFVPIMPDLRWDQCRLVDNGQIALLDLDAFVIGPKEVELILLEFLLNENQAKLFEQHYSHKVNRTGLAEIRDVYRLLLFMMNVLGEQDIERWMSAPIRF